MYFLIFLIPSFSTFFTGICCHFCHENNYHFYNLFNSVVVVVLIIELMAFFSLVNVFNSWLYFKNYFYYIKSKNSIKTISFYEIFALIFNQINSVQWPSQLSHNCNINVLFIAIFNAIFVLKNMNRRALF